MNALSLFPPLIVLIFGYTTRNIWLSLLVGLFSAAFIATDFAVFNTFELIASRLWKNLEFNKFFFPSQFWESWNAFICIFLFVLGIFVVLIQHSGGAYAYGNRIKGYLSDRRSTETSSLLLSILLFMDDYFSSLTVGSVMRPLTDIHKVPRAKLAFLVDSMAAPLTILCPFSSWVAAIIGFLRENGVSPVASETTTIIASPLSTYLLMVPFIFYSFILMATSFYIVYRRISFGLMGKHEMIARTTGNLVGGRTDHVPRAVDPHEKNKEKASLIDFLFPIAILFISVLLGMLYSGEASIFCGSRSCMEALQNSSAAIALFTGGIFSLIVITLFYLIRGKIEIRELPGLYWEGILLMLPAIIILILAWSLGDILRNNLQTGEYLASLLIGNLKEALFPVIFFIVSCLISVSIGSSWGTAAIMFPIAIPLVISVTKAATPATVDQLSLLFPVLGAVLSGAVAGDHISPISDTTVMSATSTGSPHMDHVKTQMTYAIPVIVVTALTFLLAGFLMNHFSTPTVLGISIPSGILVSCILFTFFNQSKKIDERDSSSLV